MIDRLHQYFRFAAGVDRKGQLFSKADAGDDMMGALASNIPAPLFSPRDSNQIASGAPRIISGNRFSEAKRKKQKT